MKARITISIDLKLLGDIDKIRGLATRSAFINKFLEKNLSFQTADELLRGDTD